MSFTPSHPQGLFSTLELVPMWSGVDHDVEMFASGIVAEDEGDWDSKEAAAASEGAGGSSGGEGWLMVLLPCQMTHFSVRKDYVCQMMYTCVRTIATYQSCGARQFGLTPVMFLKAVHFPHFIRPVCYLFRRLRICWWRRRRRGSPGCQAPGHAPVSLPDSRVSLGPWGEKRDCPSLLHRPFALSGGRGERRGHTYIRNDVLRCLHPPLTSPYLPTLSYPSPTLHRWVVDAGFDNLSISIRTDVAWYRLVK